MVRGGQLSRCPVPVPSRPALGCPCYLCKMLHNNKIVVNWKKMRTIAATFPAILYVFVYTLKQCQYRCPCRSLLGSAIKICPAVNEMDSNCDCDCDNWRLLVNSTTRMRKNNVPIKKENRPQNNGPPNTSYSRVEVTLSGCPPSALPYPVVTYLGVVVASSFIDNIIPRNPIIVLYVRSNCKTIILLSGWSTQRRFTVGFL